MTTSSRIAAWFTATLLAFGSGAGPIAAQTLGDGVLLIASPELTDVNFARAVVLVLRHDDNGTIGIVVNRPTNLAPATVFPELSEGIGSYTGTLFRGGPIDPTRVLMLVRGLAAATVSGPEVLDKVFLSIDSESLSDMTRLADGIDELRVYAGHAAWVAGQLQAELGAGGWKIVPGAADLVFTMDPQALWTELEQRAANSTDVLASTTR